MTNAVFLAILLGEASCFSAPMLKGSTNRPTHRKWAGLQPVRSATILPSSSLIGRGCSAHMCDNAESGGDAVTFKETSQRSLVKAIGWRFTAGVVTAATSIYYTGDLAVAASIVGWDLCSKSVTMFIGERIWNNVEWGKKDGSDSNQRSIAKAIAWRIFAACNTLFAAVVLTKGKAGVATKIAGSDSIVKTILFYFYERVWTKVSWGKVAA